VERNTGITSEASFQDLQGSRDEQQGTNLALQMLIPGTHTCYKTFSVVVCSEAL